MAGPNEFEIVGAANTSEVDDALKAAGTVAEETAAQFDALEAATVKAGDSLDAVGAAATKAADGVKIVTGATTGATTATEENSVLTGDNTKLKEENAVASDAQAAALDRTTAAIKVQRDAILLENDALLAQKTELEGMIATETASLPAMAAFTAEADTMYGSLTTLSAMGTPAILKAATWGVLLAGGAAYEGIKQYMDFQKSITQTITQAGVSPKELPFLTSLAENVSKITGVNLNDVANSIYRVASGTASWNNGLGATKKQLAEIVKSTAQLQVLGNVSGGATSEQVARIMASVVNADLRGIGTNPNRVLDVMNATVGASDTRLADWVPALGRGLMISAKANNVSGVDALGWTSLLTSLGASGSTAGNYVKTGMNLLANPSAQGTGALAMFGIKPGELEGLMGSKGGLVSAVATLNAGLKKLNPSAALALYHKASGAVEPGTQGKVSAIRKLETWMVGELPAATIKKWEAGQLSAKQQTEYSDLILTKAFGGSKQFTTIAAILKYPQRLAGIIDRINRNSTSSVANAAIVRAEATPSQQFHILLAKLQVDFVNIGKSITPTFLKLAHATVDVVDFFTRFKALGEGLLAMLAPLVVMATISKSASIAKGFASLYGGMATKLGIQPTGIFQKAYLESTRNAHLAAGQAIIDADETLGTQLDAVNTQMEQNNTQLMTLNERLAILNSEGGGGIVGSGKSLQSSITPMTGGMVAGEMAAGGGVAGGSTLASALEIKGGAANPLTSYTGKMNAIQQQMYAGSNSAYYEQNAASSLAFQQNLRQMRLSQGAIGGSTDAQLAAAIEKGSGAASAADVPMIGAAGAAADMGSTVGTVFNTAGGVGAAAYGPEMMAGAALAPETGGMSMLPMMAMMMVPALLPSLISVGQKLMNWFAPKYMNVGPGSVGNIATLQSTTAEVTKLQKEIKARGKLDWANMSSKQLQAALKTNDILAQQLALQKAEKKNPGLAYTKAFERHAWYQAHSKEIGKFNTSSFLDPTVSVYAGGAKGAHGAGIRNLTEQEAGAYDRKLINKMHLPSYLLNEKPKGGGSLLTMINDAISGKGKYGNMSTTQLQKDIVSRINQPGTKSASRVHAFYQLSAQDQKAYGVSLATTSATKDLVASAAPSDKLINSVFQGKQNSSRLQSDSYDRNQIRDQIKYDLGMAHSGKLTTAQDKIYTNQAQKDEKIERALDDLIKFIDVSRKPVLLDTQSMQDWVDAQNAKDRALIPQQAQATGAAVAAAIKGNPKALAGVVNVGQSQIINRGGP